MNDDAPTLLGLLGDGLSLPLVGICVLAGLGVGFLSAPPVPAVAATTESGTEDTETPDEPQADDPQGDVDDGPVLAPKTISRLIAAGDFEEAEREAERAGEPGLAEEAHLFAALTSRIQPGALARAEKLEEIEVGDKQLIGMIKQEDGELVVLEGYDGIPVDLPAKGLKVRRTLKGMEARRLLADRLKADRRALGDVGGLTVHRYAFWAFRANLRRLGTELLREAVCTDEGRVLVDMFGSGDYERLQRARLVVCGSLPPTGTGIPEPKPPPVAEQPKPEPTTPTPTKPQPKPTVTVTVVDPLANDPAWRKANESYAAGVREYRRAFDRVGAPELKRAIARFREAQNHLNIILDRYDGEPAQRIERRLVELNTLIYDCAKQGGVR